MFNEARKSDHAVRKGKWKYIQKGVPGWAKKKKNFKAPGAELYDLESDPGEQKNLIKDFPEVAQDMKKILEKEHLKLG